MLLFPFLTDTESWEECVEDICEDFESTKANTDESPTLPDDLHEPSTERNQGSTIVLWLLHFLVALQKKRAIPGVVVNTLLMFLCTLFRVLSPFSEVIATLARECPSSLNSAHKTLETCL